MIKPKKLSPGDRVATVCLSWGGAHAFPIRYQIGKKQVATSLGVMVVEQPNTLKAPEWLSENPQARAEDLNAALTDQSISGIFSVIGGSDSIKVVPFVDKELITEFPKILLGYSDTTITHLLFYKCGVTSFYGPAVLTGLAENGGIMPYTLESLKKTLMSKTKIGNIYPSLAGWSAKFSKWSDPDQENKPRVLRESIPWKKLQGNDKADGHLLGGCLETLVQAIGSEVWPSLEDWKDAVVFLEVSEDSKDEGDLIKNIAALKKAGVFTRPAAILIGRPPEQFLDKETDEFNRIIYQLLLDSGVNKNIPIISDMDFGHSDPFFILPYGARCFVDPENLILTIDEEVVL